MKKSLLYLILTMSLIRNVSGQSQTGFLDLLYGKEDINKYANFYLDPLFKGFGSAMNSGWYSTAKPHGVLGVDLSLSVNLAMVPTADENFTFRNSDYNYFQLKSGTEATTPTLFGPSQPGPTIQVVDHNTPIGDVVLTEFNAPKGYDMKKYTMFNAVPSPVLQLGIGLIKNTDIKVRYAPNVMKDVNYTYWGVGILHDVGQWIPVIAKLPINISIFGSYSSLTYDQNFSTDKLPAGVTATNPKVSTTANGYSIEALVSKKIAVLTILGGIGYYKANTDFKVLGNYTVTYPDAPVIPGYDPTATLVDPIGIKTSSGGMKFTLGLRCQLGPVIFPQVTYSFMGYNVLNVGFGFTFR
jgi:hypothetical protein